MCLYMADAGVIKCNWPYMDAENNCIMYYNDPDGNGIDDITFNIYLRSPFSYSDNPSDFDQGFNKLGVYVTASASIFDDTEQFIPISQFTQLNFSTHVKTYRATVTVPVPLFVGIDANFDYNVTIGYQSISPFVASLPFVNDGSLFYEYAPTPMNPAGSISETASKDICGTPDLSPSSSKLSSNTQANKVIIKDDNSLNITETTGTKIFPNPFTEDFTVQYQIEEAQEVSIEILNANGASKYVHNEYQNEGFYQKNISEIDLPKGIYFCHFKTGNKLETFKLVKMH